MTFSGYADDSTSPIIAKGDYLELTINIKLTDNKAPSRTNTYTIKLIVNNLNRLPVLNQAHSLVLSTAWVANKNALNTAVDILASWWDDEDGDSVTITCEMDDSD